MTFEEKSRPKCNPHPIWFYCNSDKCFLCNVEMEIVHCFNSCCCCYYYYFCPLLSGAVLCEPMRIWQPMGTHNIYFHFHIQLWTSTNHPMYWLNANWWPFSRITVVFRAVSAHSHLAQMAQFSLAAAATVCAWAQSTTLEPLFIYRQSGPLSIIWAMAIALCAGRMPKKLPRYFAYRFIYFTSTLDHTLIGQIFTPSVAIFTQSNTHHTHTVCTSAKCGGTY